jgi:uncharacterized cupin superfamily protein/glyoxylase-like metal-dependent hydrolase (beta-lactamase superfamily II)
LLMRDGGNVAVDPLPLSDDDVRAIEQLGGVQTIVITNRDHVRGARELRDRFHARIVTSQTEAPLLDFAPDGTFKGGDEITPGVIAIPLQGAKTPGEVALFVPELRAAICGDALIGKPAGALSLMANEKLADPAALVRSLRELWALQLEALLLGDGMPVLRGADDVLGAFLEARGGPDINRINIDELRWEPFDWVDGKYSGEDAEAGLLIGARRIGYRFTRLAPGARHRPMHAHDLQEEMYVVLEGRPTVRTPRGDVQLRPGDVMAFPTGDRGTHQLRNDVDEPCLLMLLSNNDAGDVCYYPDSQKVLLSKRDVIVAASPSLDYFAGE